MKVGHFYCKGKKRTTQMNYGNWVKSADALNEAKDFFSFPTDLKPSLTE